MTEHTPDRIWSGIEISKVLAGTLAAISAAVVGSFLGVAGTLAGAAIASIVGSIGTEIYAKSINRGARKLQHLTPAFIKAPAAVGTPEVAAATGRESPSHTVPVPARRTPRWGRIALATALLFVLAMGSLTVVELLAGRSVASLLGHGSAGTTTLSSVTEEGKKRDHPAPATSVEPSTGDSSGQPSDNPSAEPTPTGSTPAPTDTTPGTQPTTAPTTGATTGPQDPGQPGSGDGQQDPGQGQGQPDPGQGQQDPGQGQSGQGQPGQDQPGQGQPDPGQGGGEVQRDQQPATQPAPPAG